MLLQRAVERDETRSLSLGTAATDTNIAGLSAPVAVARRGTMRSYVWPSSMSGPECLCMTIRMDERQITTSSGL